MEDVLWMFYDKDKSFRKYEGGGSMSRVPLHLSPFWSTTKVQEDLERDWDFSSKDTGTDRT